ncbi:putative glycine-zipper protein [Staphylococcus devriesei]|nr:putative glycine-zipper protein [Staphylococcus devriesei]
MVLFTVFILVSDFLMNKYFVNRFGGSKLGEYAALVGVIIGCFVFPPFGIIIVPFLAVLIVELIQDFNFGKALKASLGSVMAFLASTVAQALIMIIMVIWFFIDVFLVK